MKAIFTFLAVILVFWSLLSVASADGLTEDCSIAHIPRDGDCLHPCAVSPSNLLIASVNDTTKSIVLRQNSTFFDEDYDAALYMEGDTISYVQNATKHRFFLRNDTLYYLGYENRSTDFHIDRPISVVAFPFENGSTVTEKWTGHVLFHGSTLLKRMGGISKSLVEGGWRINDGTDTIHNATRLLWTLDMAYVDMDVTSTSSGDSINTVTISDLMMDMKTVLSERLLINRMIWFAENARYPVLTDTHVSRIIKKEEYETADTIPISLFAIHYPPFHQQMDTGEEYVTSGRTKTKQKDSSNGEFNTVIDDKSSSLSAGSPEIRGDAINITLSSLEGTTDATITLYTDSGIQLSNSIPITMGPTVQTYTVTIPKDWKGVLLIAIDTGEESIIKKLVI